MAKYRTHFELSISDIQHIEESLTYRVGQLSRQVLDASGDTFRLKDCDKSKRNLEELDSIRELLGRIHGQKVWYEPKSNVPRG